ncbi:hypothetical protein AMECASPLE_026353 [Ameca splendens]|uniref:Uncharacterized protein n=1 Tax=Ameca splendens TaxID=208324 RepID=A0ABV0ZDS7_9TELE
MNSLLYKFSSSSEILMRQILTYSIKLLKKIAESIASLNPVWFGHPIRMPPGNLGGHPGADTELTGKIKHLFLPQDTLGSPRVSWGVLVGKWMSGFTSLAC